MDSQWLAKCREGDTLAIERLVQTHQQDVYRLALSILDDPDEADDATQEVFLAALRSLDSFRGDSSIKTWLFSITINLCRSRLQKGKSRVRLSQILQSLFHRDQAHPESEAIHHATDSELWRVVHALDEKHRIPVGTVHSRLNHARERLRAQLKDRQPIKFSVKIPPCQLMILSVTTATNTSMYF